jgi:hypothetical protein
MADELGRTLSPVFRDVFLLGIWAAVFSSMLGVWQGVPYLFADIVATRATSEQTPTQTDRTSWPYRGFLAFLALPPMLLLLMGKPVWLVMLYAVTGAFFMPFLALTLLYLNNRIIAKSHRFGATSNILIALALLVFGWLSAQSLLT